MLSRDFSEVNWSRKESKIKGAVTFTRWHFDVITSLGSLDRGSNWKKVTSHASHSRLRAVPVGGVWFAIWKEYFYNRDEKCLQRGTDWVFK